MTADGYFRTGDIGYLDADGYLFIVDRAKDIVIRGGENIACQEVEAALYAHPTSRRLRCSACPTTASRGAGRGGASARGHGAGSGGAPGVPCRPYRRLQGARAHLGSPVALPRLGTEKIDKVSLRNTYRALAAAAEAAPRCARGGIRDTPPLRHSGARRNPWSRRSCWFAPTAVPHPWIPASAGMTKAEGTPTPRLPLCRNAAKRADARVHSHPARRRRRRRPDPARCDRRR